MSNLNYFKGWYFKCSGDNGTIAFIPAYHLSNYAESASLQIITDNAVYNIPYDHLEYCEDPLYIKIGNCIFSEKGLKLNIQNNKLSVHGTLYFNNLSPIKYDIMGPFKFVPAMQCRHSIYSMNHRIDGNLIINGHELSFENGTGYIEGDRGSSFPGRYIWTQCNLRDDSLMLSVADIPFLAFNFTGLIGIVMLDGMEYRVATYLGARVKQICKNTIIVKQRDYTLLARLIQKNALPLYAPSSGMMSRTIHESVSCKAYYRFSFKEKTLLEFTSDRASFEFEYR